MSYGALIVIDFTTYIDVAKWTLCSIHLSAIFSERFESIFSIILLAIYIVE